MKAIDTDQLLLTRAVREALIERLTPEGDCWIFRPEGRRHLEVEVRGTHRKVLISVTRIAYALEHVSDHVGADEMVVPTCGHHGDTNGNGVCCAPAHLVKMKAVDAHRLMREAAIRKRREVAA